MKTVIRSLPCALACVAILSACQTMPQASLVYASRQTLGINISTPSPSQPDPVNFTVGFGNQDVAYVPVIADGCKVLDADYQRNLARESGKDKNKHLADCLQARGGVKPDQKLQAGSDKGKEQSQPAGNEESDKKGELVQVQDAPRSRPTAVNPYDLLHKDGNEMKIEDASSVLGTFGSGIRAGNTENTLGKFFSTGVAAQQLAEGFAYKHAAEGYAKFVEALSRCINDIKTKVPSAADNDVLVLCSSGFTRLVKEAAGGANAPADDAGKEEQKPATVAPPTALRSGGRSE